MAQPHPVLLDIATGRPPRRVADDDVLLESAFDHRMGGLLWASVSRGDVELGPAVVQQLARVHLWTRGHHRKLWRTANVVNERLAAIGAQVALFKGVAAERRWYAGEGERPCNDLDLLLRPSDVGRCHDVVTALRPDHQPAPELVELLRRGVLQSLDLRVDGVDVDLHVDLLKVEVPARQGSVFWDRSTRLSAPGGSGVRVLDAETSLVQLLLHLNKDRFARLIGFVDVARLVARDLDWDAVAGMLAAEGMTVAGSATLHRVTSTLGLAPPPLPPPRGRRAAVWHRLWPEDQMLGGRAGLVALQHRQLWLPWLAEGRTGEAVRWWLRRRAFPPAALLDYQLPGRRGPYLWHLATGRVRRFLERRAEARSAA